MTAVARHQFSATYFTHPRILNGFLMSDFIIHSEMNNDTDNTIKM